MPTRFPRLPALSLVCGLLGCLAANNASAALTYVYGIGEPGASPGQVLGVPIRANVKPAPVPFGPRPPRVPVVDQARAAKVRDYNASVARAKNIMAQIDQVQNQLFKARNEADRLYRTTHDPVHIANFRRLQQAGQQRIHQLGQLRNKEMSYQHGLVRGH